MNTGLLASLWLILAAPWQQRRNRNAMWGVAVVAGLCLLAPIALWVWSLLESDSLGGTNSELAASLRHGVLSTGGAAVGVLVLAWWATVIASILEQNEPALARLVPSHPARLRAALLLAWMPLVAGTGLYFRVVAPNDHVDPLAAAVVLGGIVLAALAASVRWPLLWILGCFVPFATSDALRAPSVDGLLRAVHEQWQVRPMEVAAFALAASALLLAGLVQDGGARHVANHKARKLRSKLFSANEPGERPIVVGTRGSFAIFTRPYVWWMERLLADARSSAQGRMALGLGPAAHWTSAVLGVVLTLAAVPVGMLLAKGLGAYYPHFLHDGVPTLLSSAAAGGMFGVMTPALQVHGRMYQTRREQALLALLPGMPRSSELSRGLSIRLTSQFLLAWCGGVAFMALLGVIAQRIEPATRPASIAWTVCMALGMLVLVTFQWRPWARLPAPTALSGLSPALVGLGTGALVAAGHQTGWVPFEASALAIAFAALAWCGWRWRRMGTEPVAFPIGRLA